MIQVGIIGCGVICPSHASSIALDDRATLRWACDLDLDKARACVEAPHYTTDYRQVIEDDACDLVVICTEHPTHGDIAIAALAAGKHVVCEKPLAAHPETLTAMVAAAEQGRERGLVASGIFQHRYRPLARRLKTLIDGGDFGPVLSAEMQFACTRTAEYYASAPWRGTWAGEGGGLMINQAIHTLDLAGWFCGRPVAVEGTVERNWLDCIDTEDQGRGTVYFADGPQCRFEAINSPTGGWESHITVRCRDGSFTLGNGYRLGKVEHASRTLMAELKACDAIRMEVKLPGKACYGDQHALQYQDVISAIATGRAPMVGFAEAAASNHVVLGLYHSTALDGARVDLPAEDYRQPTLVGPVGDPASSASRTPA